MRRLGSRDLRRPFVPLLLGLALGGQGLFAETAPAPAPAARADVLADVLAEVATRCRAHELRLVPAGSASLLLWREGGSERGDSKKGCSGERRAGWIGADGFRPLPADFLGPGFAKGDAGATTQGDRVLLTWAENGAIRASFLPAGGSQPSPPFTVSTEEPPSQVAAPFPLARPDGGFLVVYESDFYSGRRRNAVWRTFSSSAEPTGETLPAFADFISLRHPVAAGTADGRIVVAGPGLGPVSEGYFFQVSGPEGDPLHEPLALDNKATVLGGDLATVGDVVVFTWNIRAAKGQEKAFLRLYTSDGQPRGPARELGPTVGTPRLASLSGSRALLVYLEPGPAGNRVHLLDIEPAGAAATSRPGPETPPGVRELALDAAGHRLAWAEAERIVITRLP